MQTRSVLVVDDELDMRIAITHVLNRSGYPVESAASGQEALMKFKKEKYGVVITDVKMPKMSGMDVLGEIKKISPHVPVIMMSAYGTISKAVEAMKMGASDYLLKPFSPEKLEAVVNNVCAGRKKNRIQYKHKDSDLPINSAGKKIITQDPKFLKMLELAKNVASSNATILIQGESGTGKEILASYIHRHSAKKNGPYVAVNCAALPDSLAENELFGHEKGSFTGAVSKKPGKFELAENGTIVLDEISEMPIPVQAKFLRVLQEREVYRVGGGTPVLINARVIAISNVDLAKAVKEGKFRDDLFYRINVVPFTVPPLRERRGDIHLLTDYFLSKYASVNDGRPKKFADQTLSILKKYDWKGNVRELENTVERAMLLGEGDIIMPSHLFLKETLDKRKRQIPIRAGLSVKEMEKELIFQTLKEVDDNRIRAAELLGISIRTLRNKLNEYKCNA